MEEVLACFKILLLHSRVVTEETLRGGYLNGGSPEYYSNH